MSRQDARRKKDLKMILNKILELRPIDRAVLNVEIPFREQAENLRALEKLHPEIGLATVDGNPEGDGMTVLSLIATITDVLVGDRLAWVTQEGGRMTAVCWYSETQ